MYVSPLENFSLLDNKKKKLLEFGFRPFDLFTLDLNTRSSDIYTYIIKRKIFKKKNQNLTAFSTA